MKFKLVDQRLLAASVGTLNPKMPRVFKEAVSIRDALGAFRESNAGAVLVMNDAGKLAGIFTERDVLLKAIDPDAQTKPLRDVMTASPQCVGMLTPIAHILSMMSTGGFRHMPVVDDDLTPLGMVSVRDIVDYLAHSLAG